MMPTVNRCLRAHFSLDSDAKAPKAKVDADRLAVKGLYGLIFDVTHALNGGRQMLNTDHPYFDDVQRLKDAVVERWIDGKSLSLKAGRPPSNKINARRC